MNGSLSKKSLYRIGNWYWRYESDSLYRIGNWFWRYESDSLKDHFLKVFADDDVRFGGVGLEGMGRVTTLGNLSPFWATFWFIWQQN